MNPNVPELLRIAGVVILTVVAVHFIGLPFGLVTGCGLALLLLP